VDTHTAAPGNLRGLGYAPPVDQSAHRVGLDSDLKIRNVSYVADC